MVGSVDPFTGSGKLRFRGTVATRKSALLLVHLDHDASHRLCVPADDLDLLVGHRFRVLAEQFTTARDRDRLRLLFCMMENSIALPLNASRDDSCWLGGALRRVDVAVDAPMSV